jgi:large subunit ribosomal protein L19
MDASTLIEHKTNPKVADVEPGDSVRVTIKLRERDRERLQAFEGVVIAVRNVGGDKSFTVRRVTTGNIGVERTFFAHSPIVDSVVILRRAKVRRAKLFYLRGRTGRAARLKERGRLTPGAGAAASIAPLATAEDLASASEPDEPEPEVEEAEAEVAAEPEAAAAETPEAGTERSST